MDANALYIYGIVDGKCTKDFESPGLGGQDNQVFTLPFKDVTAIVSHTPFIEYDPTEDNVIAHEKVIQELVRENVSIAPMRFCTIVKGRHDVLKLMQSAYLALKKNILNIRNKREFGVKVFLDIEKLQKQGVDDDALVKKSVDIATELNERLSKFADEATIEEQITDEMIMNAFFLVHNEKSKEFYQEISEFDNKFTDIVKIRISGPTAPYNFVNMPTK